MERLDLSVPPENLEIESAIHLARYANIAALVKDKVVLDAACGEGYGAALLMKAGAKRVVGIDVSAHAVEQAKRLFERSGCDFRVLDVSEIATQFPEGTFDVVVSIETIEHVESPTEFLRAVKYVAKPRALFYLTCPNDYWYYPDDGQRNPYHLRKFTFEEFVGISSDVLGSDVKWGLGSGIFGFGTVEVSGEGIEKPMEKLFDSWVECKGASSSYVVSNQSRNPVTPKNCSYFMGLWNAPSDLPLSSGHFLLSMDVFNSISSTIASNVGEVEAAAKAAEAAAVDTTAMLTAGFNTQIKDMETDHDLIVKELQANLALEKKRHHEEVRQALREATNRGLLLNAAQSENGILRGKIQHFKNDISVKIAEVSALEMTVRELEVKIQEMEIPYSRYVRISSKIPQRLKTTLLKLYRKIS